MSGTSKKEKEIELLHTILQHCDGSIFVTDGEGRIIFSNDESSQALGLATEDLLHMTIYDLVDAGITKGAVSVKVIERRCPVTDRVYYPGHRENIVTGTPVFDDSGNLIMVVVYGQGKKSISERIKFLEERDNAFSQAVDKLLDFQSESHIVAESPTIQTCFSMAKNAAHRDSSVMLYGESGSGKEIMARFIYKNSYRAQRLFLPVNCAAIPLELMESEFFGYERGAFTGANHEGKRGLFELADGGTLFLDEIGELNLPMQAKLLRVLATGEVQRVGGSKPKKVDVRIIAATNRDLRLMMEDGTFREDLYYRLNVIPITIPPLRKRHEDITVLATQFLCQLNKKYSTHKLFSGPALAALQNYDWPGNIRELRNVVERVFVIIPEDMITEQHIRDILGVSHTVAASAGEEMALSEDFWESSLQTATERFQRAYLTRVLRSCGGNIRAAARYAGIGRSGLYKKLDRMGMMEKSHWIDPDKSS